MSLLKSIVKESIYFLSPYKPHSKTSYSQCGEDLIIQYIFNLRKITKPSYLDIGANHPYNISNTALFYRKGCKGMSIEANPQLAKLFKIHRPKEISLNIGIGNKEDELDFYIMQDHTLSTFSKTEADKMIGMGKALREVKKLKLLRLKIS